MKLAGGIAIEALMTPLEDNTYKKEGAQKVQNTLAGYFPVSRWTKELGYATNWSKTSQS